MLLDGRVVAATAFEKLVETHHSEIHRYLWRVVALGASADDLAAETFLRAFRNRGSLSTDADPRAWLFAIATRLCRNHLRSERRRPATSARGRGVWSADGIRPDAETAQDARGRLEADIRHLPVSQRLAFTMRRFHDLAYEAIGVSLGCSARQARGHVYRAFHRIRHKRDAAATGAEESLKAVRDPR